MAHPIEFTTIHPQLHAHAHAATKISDGVFTSHGVCGSDREIFPVWPGFTRHEVEVLTHDVSVDGENREEASASAKIDSNFGFSGKHLGTKLTVDISTYVSINTEQTGIVSDVASHTRDSARAPILFLHGLASNMSIFYECAQRAIAESHHVAIVSVREHLGSVTGSDASAYGDLPGLSVFQVAYDVLQVIRHIRSLSLVGWDRPIICIGHSYGGNVLVELASMLACKELLSGIVCVDGGYIHLQRKYESLEACCRALAPPSLSSFSHASFMHMVRSEWTRGWSEESVTAMLRNFVFSPEGTIRARLVLQAHMGLLRDLYEHPPSFENVHVPVLMAPAGLGNDNVFSSNVREDISIVVEELATIGKRCVVKWFPESSHDIPSQQPEKLMGAVFEAIAASHLS